MARYMIFENAFLGDGNFYEASLEKPLIINLPDDYVPSIKWKPLDQGAKAALEKYAKEKIALHTKAGMPEHLALATFRVKPMPKGAAQAPEGMVLDVKPVKPATPDQIEQRAFDQAVKKANAPSAPEVTVTPGKRPSDAEPK